VTAVTIVLAAGAGERLGRGEPKAFLEIAGRPLLRIAAEAAAAARSVSSLVVAVPRGEEDRARGLLADLPKPAAVVAGGATRHGSVRLALHAVPGDVEAIVCHDAARPFAPPDLFEAVLEALAAEPAAHGIVPGLPVVDTVKLVERGWVAETMPRERLVLAQTPQAFRAEALREAHARALAAGKDFSDDAACMEWAGYRIRLVPGDPASRKVTTLEDLAHAEFLAATRGGPAAGGRPR
jgi:2-C-methyl-D-erythritol 4-phosphate cytidylyltransferase